MKSFAKLAATLSGIRGGAEVVECVLALAEAENSQIEVLQSIQGDLDLLRNEPYQTAIKSLRDASRVGPSDPTWTLFLSRAEENFYSATSLAKTNEERSLAEFNLGFTWLLLSHSPNAEQYIAQSCRSASEAMDGYARECVFHAAKSAGLVRFSDRRTDGPILPSRFSILTQKITRIVDPTGKSLKSWEMHSRAASENLDALLAFQHFYNLVQYSYAKISTGFNPSYLNIDGSRIESSRLKPIEWDLIVTSTPLWLSRIPDSYGA